MKKENEREWEGKTGGGNFGQRFLLWFLRRVNVYWLYPMLFIAIPFYLIVGRQGRKASYSYFRNRHQFSWLKSCWEVLKNHVVFGTIVLDKFALLAGNKKQFTIQLDPSDVIQKKFNDPKGFLIAGAHVGNLEMAGLSIPHQQKRINGIIFGGESADFQKKRTDAFEDSDVHLIPVSNDMSHLFTIKEVLEKGEVVVIPCDRVFGSSKTVCSPFLNGQAEFPIGTFRLAAQLDVPVIFLFIMKEGWTTYRVFSEELSSSDEASNEAVNSTQKATILCKEYVKVLERILHQYPSQWFNFFPFWKDNSDNK